MHEFSFVVLIAHGFMSFFGARNTPTNVSGSSLVPDRTLITRLLVNEEGAREATMD